MQFFVLSIRCSVRGTLPCHILGLITTWPLSTCFQVQVCACNKANWEILFVTHSGLLRYIYFQLVCCVQVLQKRLQESGMPLEPYAAYLDIREYGTVPHAGFGLGFERLILFATGLENIREAIPFPRWPGHAEC